ncbi:Heat-labile enterotoxin IIB, A chain [Metarhizium album ARSEF 1941]|uniref:Heat-labile enterotoxin IIB, A chain n=1 Tax=Metarhizium album (strain ARSEF 1941) TaxID=1081103 RepID=A0A0B2WXP8_METAS|nr:Heat-labile enterotoxin IIB, A chain [Metarhizium album ARSEF 1941]KHN98349.1 Heat-labile enterotoxin IIB, A chain [Metarhizium album ARSEF 1941]
MRTSFWVSTTALVLLSGLCQSRSEGGRSIEATLERRTAEHLGEFDEEFPEVVYHGEIGRSPEQVKQAGGFYSRGMQRSLSGHRLSIIELEEGSSLFRHAAGETSDYTRFVSTSADPGVSLTFAVDDEHPRDKGFVYRIHRDSKMVDVNRSLGKYSPYPGQKEHAAIQFIPYQQVEGWWVVTYQHHFSNPAIGKRTQKRLRRGRLRRHYHKNPDFDRSFASFASPRDGGRAPGLAGFPRHSIAWDEDTWKEFKTIPVSRSLDAMVEKRCTGKYGCTPRKLKTAAGSGKSGGGGGGRKKRPAATAPVPVDGPMDPGKPKASKYRVFAQAGTLVGFNVLAPYLRTVLRLLREWDHPIGRAVRAFDDSINDLQEAIGGPRRTDISGNDNQAALINFFKKVFWLLQGPGRREKDLQLLSYGKKKRMRLVGVNDVLSTCERVSESPPVDERLRAELTTACAGLRKVAIQVEMPKPAALKTGQAACRVCGLSWDDAGGQCIDASGTIRWPREPPPESTCSASDGDGDADCGDGQTAADLQQGQAVCAICGSNWYPDEGRCRDDAGVLLWPHKTCAGPHGRMQCEGSQTAAQLETGRGVCRACGFVWDPEGGECRNEDGALLWPPGPSIAARALSLSGSCGERYNLVECPPGQTAAQVERGHTICRVCGFMWNMKSQKCRDKTGAVIWPPAA